MSQELVQINNYMENIVLGMIDSVMDNLKGCKCEKCRLDIIALALNSLEPKYVVTRNGMLYTKLNILQSQFEVDALSAITKAAIKVKECPRHE
jgi:competence protein ComFB